MKIALITPKHKEDYLANTVLDGLLALKEEGKDLEIHYSSFYKTYLPIKNWFMERNAFIKFAREAEVILFFWGKQNTDYELVNEISRWDKTFYIDGSELGGNKRLNEEIIKKVKDGSYEGEGRVDLEMLRKCKAYFRREKPYLEGITPLPFGIERRYVKNYKENNKDIDIACIFGQVDFPPLRREIKESLEKEKRKGELCIVTEPTKPGFLGRFFGLGADGGREKFYEILSRAKAGVSVSGGGYDTARFWEILGNNCILLTEDIDIYEENSTKLPYQRIWQFDNIEKFKKKFAELKTFLKEKYAPEKMKEEYQKILAEHSTRARVMTILERVQ